MALILKNIVKKFGKICAVDNISFEVENGEFLTLLGPSGCGKSTLLRMISGLEKVDEGEGQMWNTIQGVDEFRASFNKIHFVEFKLANSINIPDQSVIIV